MFSAYMQEVILQNFIIFNLFYLYFCFGTLVFIGNSSFKVFGVLTWLGSVTNITLLYAHTHTHTHTYTHTHTHTQSLLLNTSLTTWTKIIITFLILTQYTYCKNSFTFKAKHVFCSAHIHVMSCTAIWTVQLSLRRFSRKSQI
jgi:hypothetical protein